LSEAPGRPSLRARLVRHVLLPLALTWLIGTSLTVWVAYYFAQKAFDRALLDDAYALASRVRAQPQGLALDLSSREMSTVLFDHGESIFFVVRRPDGTVMAGHPGLHAPLPRSPAFVLFAHSVYDGRSLRTVTLIQDEPDDFVVMVGQTTRSRQALLRDVLIYSVVPQLLLLGLLALWLRRIIGQELRPLSALQHSVEQRDARDLRPLPVSASSRDIAQLSLAINALLAQREFSGNVAHELRTPLAGIRALTEYGLVQSEPAVWREQLQRIGASEARASRLVEQLLALALADEADTGVRNEPVALDELVRETVLRYLPRADAAGVDLGVQGLDQPVHVIGNAALIEGLLGNLLDNALRHARPPAGQPGTVTVELAREPGGVRLSVLDNGPGLDVQERRHLLQRGVRGLHAQRLGEGAGLGLAIVGKFAEVMGATFELGDAPGGRGLRASVLLRAAP
jgi:two-component system sensor histidine kinase TctE